LEIEQLKRNLHKKDVEIEVTAETEAAADDEVSQPQSTDSDNHFE
jgi:hypothetical protein